MIKDSENLIFILEEGQVYFASRGVNELNFSPLRGLPSHVKVIGVHAGSYRSFVLGNNNVWYILGDQNRPDILEISVGIGKRLPDFGPKDVSCIIS